MSMFTPKKYKFRKVHVGVNKGLATSRTDLSFADYGIKVLGACDIKANQLESARVSARKGTGKAGKIFFRIFADLPRSKKPLEVRMGSGKGPVDHWAARVRPGTIIMEIGGVDREHAYNAFKRASHKLPVKTAFISRTPVA